jgi:Spx/MgsR family transcriptional regulator
MVKIYGIPNCDTMKKARQWLSNHGIDYEFHNYKKAGVDERQLTQWIESIGWEALLNRRSTTWRQLDDAVKSNIDKASAIRIMLQTPSIIKRPLLDDGRNLYLGFKATEYDKIFS